MARYLSAAGDAGPGGDWYDVISSHHGRVLVIGDIAGHDASAAAAMWEMRARLRSALWDGKPPSSALAELNTSMVRGGIFGTCCCVQIRGNWATIVSAGHLPPILMTGTRATALRVPVGVPMGVEDVTTYTAAAVPVQRGALVALYTDGLIERRGESITDGIDRLTRTLGRGPHELDELADFLFADLAREERSGTGPDDTTLLLHRVEPVSVPHPAPLDLTLVD
ncbi:PP2C family protein-serine/threonine phosphatase [Rhabdothermincola sp.]|uniref:PP2C family protein-serine/threonine phosphatase n=1 Tax=Rhabdothermincola sp. TaxID=2820405 RepID=UPI002FDF6DB8